MPEPAASRLLRPLRIGDISLSGNVLLAPLAGITDYPLRKICRRFGASLVVSEMISSQAIIRSNRRAAKMASTSHEEYPLMVQISGSDPEVMAQAARINQAMGAAIIDINMGCPQRKIVKTGAGAALMKTPELAEKIIKAVKEAVSCPVTVKMRLGWDSMSCNAVELAQAAEEAGVALVTVHGRTRAQIFSGQADWHKIRDVVQAVNCPVIANGDITSPEDARRCLEITGAAGIMIGRGALGRPWLFRQVTEYLEHDIMPPSPSLSEQHEIILEHLQGLIDFYGKQTALWLSRKHLGWYSKGLGGSANFRRAVNYAKSIDHVVAYTNEFYTWLARQRRAMGPIDLPNSTKPDAMDLPHNCDAV